jgi:hypothetical protein
MSEIKVKPIYIAWKREWDGKHGTIHVFDMTVEREDDGTTVEGVFTTTKKDQNKFTKGQSVTVKLGKTQEDHQDVVKFDIVKPRNSGGGYSGGGGGSRKDPRKDKAIVANVCLGAARRLLIHQDKGDQVKQDMVAVHAVANKFFDHLFSVTGDDIQKQINYQAQLKDVADTLHEFPNVKFSNSTEFLAIVDKEYQWVCDKMG